jgi:hypothetical protein
MLACVEGWFPHRVVVVVVPESPVEKQEVVSWNSAMLEFPVAFAWCPYLLPTVEMAG